MTWYFCYTFLYYLNIIIIILDLGSWILEEPSSLTSSPTSSSSPNLGPKIPSPSNRVGLSLQPNTNAKPVNKVTFNKTGASISCTWNIRRGLLTRELKLKNLLIQEKIDFMMLTETDSHSLINESSYEVQGYKTILPIKSPTDTLVRIVCLVKESLFSSIKMQSYYHHKNF